MISDLAPILESVEFEEYGSILVWALERHSDDATLTLLITTGVEGQAPVERHVKCQGVQAGIVSFQAAYSIEEVADDPALWRFSEPHARLYFSGAPTDQPQRILGALYSEHMAVVGDAIDAVPFGMGLNAKNSLPSGYGLAAEGPLPLLHAYERVLQQHGATTSIAGERSAKIWKDDQWVLPPKPLRLLVVGDTWIVARAFTLDPPRKGAV